MIEITQPKAILFDLDGTILDGETGLEDDWRAACEAGAAQARGLDARALFSAVQDTRKWYWSDPERAREGRMQLLQASTSIVYEALVGLAYDRPELAAAVARDYRTRRDAAMAPFPGAVAALDAVRARGIATALVTNGAAGGQRAKVERFGLAPYFDCIVIEGEFGAGKPDERVFVHALTALSCDPAAAWMVGDNLEADIATPHRLGMHTVWVDAQARGLPKKPPVQPHRIVRSIAELA